MHMIPIETAHCVVNNNIPVRITRRPRYYTNFRNHNPANCIQIGTGGPPSIVLSQPFF